MRKKRILRITLFLVVLGALLSACVQNNTTPETADINSLEHIPYCSDDTSKLCVEGFGKETNERLLILFKAKTNDEKNILVYVTPEDQEKILFDCYLSDAFSKDIYCTGNILPEGGSKIKIDAYASNETTLLGSGNFRIQYGQIDFLGKIPLVGEPESKTPANYPNYPNDPNYPNYPNQSP